MGDLEDDAFGDAVTKGSRVESLWVLHRPPAVVSLDNFRTFSEALKTVIIL